MDTYNNNGVSLADTNGSCSSPNPTMKEEISSELENLETLGCIIEEGVEKISLLGGGGGGASETCETKIEENGHNHDEIEGEGKDKSESESESESSETESATSSSSGSSSGESSSGSGSGSDSDSDEDDDDEEEDEEEEGDGDAHKMVSWSMVDDDDIVDGDDDDGVVGGGPIKSKNELEDLPSVPPVDVTLEPHHQMLPVGVVMSVLGARVIVEGLEKHDPLSEGSILWMTDSRKPLGFVDEIFGPVKNPYYVVRYNSENEVPTGILGGTLISFVPEFANHVLNNKDLYKKGYDASGANDEELSDEIEFSDDEKEEEYKRMQRMAKRGTNDQNPGKTKNNKKKASVKKHSAPTIPNAPPAPTNHGAPAAPPPFDPNSLSLPGIGQGLFQGANAFPPFPIPQQNASPNFATNGVWTNPTLPQQLQSALLSNAFPTNGIPWYPQNAQFSNQLPLPGIPFQHQLNPNQGPMLPEVQANILAQAMLAQGLMAQNQITFGLNTTFPQIRPQQGFPSSGFQQPPERNLNLNSSTVPGAAAPPQFHHGASASNGRQTFRGAGRGRKAWRPAK